MINKVSAENVKFKMNMNVKKIFKPLEEGRKQKALRDRSE